MRSGAGKTLQERRRKQAVEERLEKLRGEIGSTRMQIKQYGFA